MCVPVLLLVTACLAVHYSSNAAGLLPVKDQEKVAEQVAPPSINVEGIWESDLGAVYTVEKKGEIYLVRCTTGDVGIGRLVGGTFSFGYGGSVRAGLASYKIDQTDKIVKMVGEWSTLPGNGKWAAEELTKIKEFDKKQE
jgi:hypothetical protein